MDYVLKNRLHSSSCEILDVVSQQPVDLDFTLADYCADIEKILKCSLIPKIFSRSFSAGELRVDGSCVVRVLYCDQSKKALRCCEQTVPFTATIPVQKEMSEHIILVGSSQEYLNCRALTPRRLTVHGAFSISATIIGRKVSEINEQSKTDSLQTLSKSKVLCELTEFSQEQFSVIETATLNQKNRVESIIRSEILATVTDCCKSGGKLLLKGEITLRMLYLSDAASGECDRFVYVFPFTQSIDAKDSEWDISDIRLDVLSYDLLLKSEMLSDDPALTIDVKLSAALMGYKNTEVTYICDAYSTNENVDVHCESETFLSVVHPIVAAFALKSPVYLGDRKICKILDIFSETPSVNTEVQNDKIRFFGKVNICILGYTEDGELVSVERQTDFDHTENVQIPFGYAKHPKVSVTTLSFRMSDNNELELRLDMRINTTLCGEETISQVTSVTSIGEFANPVCDNALVLYYAGKGESVWNIAKRYKTPMNSICDENDITEDTLSADKMLLILKS